MTPLIVGAGPSGLAAALFLHERGIRARIVDAAIEPSPWSRALGVNPRTLDLLEPSGVAAAILAEGQPIEAMRISQSGRAVATIAFERAAIGARYPMTALPQARTEAMLAEALAQRDVRIERGVRFASLTQDETGVRAELVHPDGSTETARTALLLGADGAHSAVRKALGIDFAGDSFPDIWTLADLELAGPAHGAIHVDFTSDGPFVALPISGQRWRLIAMGGDVLARLPAGWSAGAVDWQSEFQISHRMAERMSIGRVALAGDAAHIHSPIGARGMNLGIEDAWVWAACAADAVAGRTERIDDYGRVRLDVDARIVNRLRRVTAAVRARGIIADVLRRSLPPIVARVPALRRGLLRQIAGLDHTIRFV